MSDKVETLSYIARCNGGCGGIRFAIVDDPARSKDTAKEVAKVITQGYTIERATSQEVRSGWGCRCEGSAELEAEKQMRLFK